MADTVYHEEYDSHYCDGSVIIEGMRFPAHLYDPQIIRSALAYNARPDDIFIATTPRSGTTWMQTIVYSLLNNGRGFDEDIDDFIACNPFLEMYGPQAIEAMPRAGAIKTHVLFEHLPYHPNAKYIFVIRNPKDVCVSFHRFIASINDGARSEITFDYVFEQFLAGRTGHVDYFDYLISCWCHKDDPNVLLVLYEDMKRNIRAIINQIASFLNIKMNKKLLEHTVMVTNVDYLKQKRFNERITPAFSAATFEFVRKGVVGDWQTVLTDKQNRLLNARFEEKTKDIPDLYSLWDEYNVFDK